VLIMLYDLRSLLFVFSIWINDREINTLLLDTLFDILSLCLFRSVNICV
jgi:hypothetical protein